MKTLKHICFTSHGEVMFRDTEDVRHFFNMMVISAWKYQIQLLVDTEMSNHVHLILLGEQVGSFVKELRKRYTMHFNNRYGRSGKLGEKGYFCLEISGNNHIIAAISYVLRNPLHHGVTGTAFAYRFSAINDLFREDLGKFDKPTLLKSREDIARELPRRAEFPDSFRMTTEGWFTRESTMELRQTELLFVSPAAFEYNMFRRTDERWKEEQMRDPGSLRPISFADIEPENAERFMQEYLRNEKAGTFRNTAAPDDFELCRIIDREILPAMGKRSVYELSRQNRQEIARFLQFQKKATVPSIQRCLVC